MAQVNCWPYTLGTSGTLAPAGSGEKFNDQTMGFENIKSKANKLAADIKRTDARRQYWNDNTKKLIYDTLSNVKGDTTLDWSIQKIDEYKNREFVNIQLSRRHTGIIETERFSDKVKSKAYLIEGGFLTFTQAVNGKIYSIISYPYVEDLISKMDALIIGLFDPEEITEDLIFQHVEIFLDEMIKWQNNHPKEPIGF